MTKIKLRYVISDVDRHGNARHYFRRDRKQPKIRLRGQPGSPEFMADYHAAMDGRLTASGATQRPHEVVGTFRALAHQYYHWSDFQKLAIRSQQTRRNILEAFMVEFGVLPYAKFERRHVRAVMEAKAGQGKFGAANSLLKVLRHMFKYAVQFELVRDDPTRGVRKAEYRKSPIHSWTLAEVEQYEAHWPIGTPQRLALALLLYTGQRRQDMVLFGRQHIKDGALVFTQRKSLHLEHPVTLEIPILPELQAIIDATPRTGLTLLESQQGKGFTAAGFGNRFREWCDKAGLPQCSAHGLRKAAATRLADLGATPHQIASITGHRTLAEVAHYTRAADQKRAARGSIHMLKRQKNENDG